jgi:hypothetical protein
MSRPVVLAFSQGVDYILLDSFESIAVFLGPWPAFRDNKEDDATGVYVVACCAAEDLFGGDPGAVDEGETYDHQFGNLRDQDRKKCYQP